MLTIEKFSLGVGDRFAHQARPQLRACMMAADQGADVVPVWNKSNREHNIIGSEPASVRAAAEQAVKELGWSKPFHVDADHINLTTVDRFLGASDFYTLDVADAIGKAADAASVDAFVNRHPELGARTETAAIAGKYLFAVQEAGRIYRHIKDAKGEGNFITEVSMDETDCPPDPARAAGDSRRAGG